MKDYEIKDVMRRGEQPILTVRLSSKPAFASKDLFGQDSIVIPIKAFIANRNSTPAIFTSLRIFFDSRFKVVEKASLQPSGEVSLGQEDVVAVFRNFAPPNDFPIFRETPPEFIELKIATPKRSDPTTYFVAAHVATPGFSRLYRGSILVVDGNATLHWPD